MEMDCNLKKLASFFFQVLPVYSKEIARNQLKFILSRGNHFAFFSQCCESNFKLEKTFFVKSLSRFDNIQQNLRDSAPALSLTNVYYIRGPHLQFPNPNPTIGTVKK